MYILDAEGKKEVAVKAENFMVVPQAGNDDTSFEMIGENPDENGATAVYMLDDKDLSISIPLGVNITFTIDGKEFKGEIKAHKPLDH